MNRWERGGRIEGREVKGDNRGLVPSQLEWNRCRVFGSVVDENGLLLASPSVIFVWNTYGLELNCARRGAVTRLGVYGVVVDKDIIGIRAAVMAPERVP